MFGSLTFGGYDRSRFVPNNVSLFLAADISRDLVVGLQSMSSTITNGTTTQQQLLLPNPIRTFIDSTLPYIYLPIEACQLFEKTLGLVWDSTLEMYWVNDTLHRNSANCLAVCKLRPRGEISLSFGVRYHSILSPTAGCE